MKKGELIVYCGPMFSGKTSGLIAEIQIQMESKPGEKIKVYKPSLDNRYDAVDIKTHEGYSLKELTGIDVSPVPLTYDFADAKDADFIGIDEAQFFDHEIINTITDLLNSGINVVLSGLELDSDGKPFGAMSELLEMADYVEQLFAVCVVCDGPADRTFRKAKKGGQILVGGSDLYEPRCMADWLEGMTLKH